MPNFLFAIDAVGPVFLIVLLGYLLKGRLFGTAAISFSSKLVFSTALPALIFTSIAVTEFTSVFDLRQVLFACGGTIVFFLLTWLVAFFTIPNKQDRGPFVQGSFRSNFAIIGFALVARAFSGEAVSRAALLLAFVMPLYNVLSVIVLTVSVDTGRGVVRRSLIGIAQNPLIIAALLGIPFSLFRIPLPNLVQSTLNYLSAMTLPLALLSIGASLDRRSFTANLPLALFSSAIKVVVLPAILTALALALGFRGEKLGVLFILFASPTAVASFSMTHAMGCNAKLAANIILITTVASACTVAGGIFILKTLGLL